MLSNNSSYYRICTATLCIDSALLDLTSATDESRNIQNIQNIQVKEIPFHSSTAVCRIMILSDMTVKTCLYDTVSGQVIETQKFKRIPENIIFKKGARKKGDHIYIVEIIDTADEYSNLHKELNRWIESLTVEKLHILMKAEELATNGEITEDVYVRLDEKKEQYFPLILEYVKQFCLRNRTNRLQLHDMVHIHEEYRIPFSDIYASGLYSYDELYIRAIAFSFGFRKYIV